MDWMFTDTALGLSSWLQFEDIYSNVYLLKCARWAETVNKYKKKKGFFFSNFYLEISNRTWRTSTKNNEIWCWWIIISFINFINMVSIIILFIYFIILQTKSTNRS
jgi:hypothetical protein